MKKISGLFLIFLVIEGIHSQNYDSLLSIQLSKNVKTLSLNDGKLEGEGADFLFSEAGNSQFFLIGEDHGIADIARFSNALFNRLNKLTYNHYATEVGPYTERILSRMVVEKTAKKDCSDLYKTYPFSIPFFNWVEETEMLINIKNRSSKNEIWGLDQEFIAGCRILLKDMIAKAPNKTAKNLVTSYYEKSVNDFKTALANKSSASFLFLAKKETFDNLRESVGHKKTEIWNDMVDELEVSWEIYQKFFTKQGFASNQQRANLMKKHFMDYYRHAQKSEEKPKVLVKLGANHTYRGANALNAFDIGNFLNEFAGLNQTKSFHLLVIGLKGTKNDYNPFVTEKEKNNAFDISNEPYLKAILPVIDKNRWNVIDLRPLRESFFYRKIKNIDPKLEKVIWSFDAILVMPNVSAAKNMSDLEFDN